jgi:hypothetical protein
VVRKLAVFFKDRIGLPFGRSRIDPSEDLATYWLALNLHVMRGNVDPVALIEVGDGNGHGPVGTTMTVQAILRTVQDGWGHWNRKTVAYWSRILEEANQSLLPEEAATTSLQAATATVEI